MEGLLAHWSRWKILRLSGGTLTVTLVLQGFWSDSALFFLAYSALLVAVACGTFFLLDDAFNSLCLQNAQSQVVRVVQGQIQHWFHPQARRKTSPGSSPAKLAQADLQREVETYVKNILKCYISTWADQISQGQTLDREVENDLRRALNLLVENIRELDFQSVLHEALQTIRFHYEKILSQDEFQYSHPLLVQTEHKSGDMELYFVSATHFILKKLQASTTISTRVVFDVMVNIIAKKMLLELFNSYSEPSFWHSLVTDPALTLKTDEMQYSTSREASPNPRQYVKSKSAIEPTKKPSKSKMLSRKTTMDLTGYSNQSPIVPPIRESQTTGKISNALGGLFSATAGPLLPDNIAFKSFNKMWRSNSNDSFQLDMSPEQSSPVKKLLQKKSTQRKTMDQRLLPASSDLDPLINGTLEDNLSHSPGLRRRHSSAANLDVEDLKTLAKATTILDESRRVAQAELLQDLEEGENLESSISKLRALLDQRQKSESESTDSVFISQEDGRDTESNVLNLEDLPSDGRLIINVKIPEIECPNIRDESFTPQEEDFPLFCIQYDGIYVEPTSPGSSFRYILQHRLVKRKFKEFLNLHAYLEANSKLRGEIKGIKNPSKWLNLPFSKHSEQSLENKRLFLEKWLVTLCHQPIVAVSKELGDFLAYGATGHGEYARKSGQDGGKMDRLLGRTMSGVIHSIKDALPNFEDDTNSLQLTLNGHGPKGDHLVPVIYSPNRPYHSLNALALTPTTSVPDGFFGKKSMAPSRDYHFNFVTNGAEQTDFECTVGFHLEYFDQKLKALRKSSLCGSLDGCTSPLESPAGFESGPHVLKANETNGAIILDLIAKFASQKYPELDLEVIQTLIKGVFEDLVDTSIQDTLRDWNGEAVWTTHLKQLRNWIWPPNSELQLSSGADVFHGALKDPTLHQHFIDVTSSKRANQELVLNLFELILWNLVASPKQQCY